MGEGHIRQEQATYYAKVARLPFVETVCEIGFNGGHSTAMWLSTKNNIRLFSFDIGDHHYMHNALQFINFKFPGRLNLTLGNSLTTVPEFVSHNPGLVCDLLHVDGGHMGDVPARDLVNMRGLAGSHSIVVMDDINCQMDFCLDPQKAWDHAKATGLIEELDCARSKYKGWCVGRYLL